MNTIYLAHPHRSADFVKAILQLLIEGWGFKVINPFDKHKPQEWEKNASKEYAEKIVREDISSILKSDIVVVYPSTGKSMELLIGFQQHKPVVVWDNISNPSSPWILAHATTIVRSLDELKQILQRLRESESDGGSS